MSDQPEPTTQARGLLLDTIRSAVLDPAVATLLTGEGKPALVALVSLELLEKATLDIEAEAADAARAKAEQLADAVASAARRTYLNDLSDVRAERDAALA